MMRPAVLVEPYVYEGVVFAGRENCANISGKDRNRFSDEFRGNWAIEHAKRYRVPCVKYVRMAQLPLHRILNGNTNIGTEANSVSGVRTFPEHLTQTKWGG